MVRVLVGAAACMLLLLWATGVSSAKSGESETDSPAACSQVDYGRHGEVTPSDVNGEATLRPPNPDGATLVGVGFHVDSLRGIDPVQNQFQFRGYVRAIWCDPRLAFDSEAEGQTELIFTGERAEKEIKRIWLVAGYPVNRVGELGASERVLRIRSDGSVVHSLNDSVTHAKSMADEVSV